MRGRGHGQRNDHRAALSWIDVSLALLGGLLIWVILVWFIRMLSSPPPEVDPDDIVAVDQDYKCSVCGAELTLKAVNVAESKAPRHCREEMVAVWRPPGS